nr:MAG TPA: hypothetical protein [Caudoviricetes sp.]
MNEEMLQLEDIEDFLGADCFESESEEDETFEDVPYVAPTLEETLDWLHNVWDESFESAYSEMQANGNYWSADMQIEAHNQYVREHLESLVRSAVLSDEEAEQIYREIER